MGPKRCSCLSTSGWSDPEFSLWLLQKRLSLRAAGNDRGMQGISSCLPGPLDRAHPCIGSSSSRLRACRHLQVFCRLTAFCEFPSCQRATTPPLAITLSIPPLKPFSLHIITSSHLRLVQTSAPQRNTFHETLPVRHVDSRAQDGAIQSYARR